MKSIKLEFEHGKTKGEVSTNIQRFLDANGYKVKEISEQKIEGEKGSLLRNAISFNPLNWKNTFLINFNMN